jgi:hypothetical protein
MLSGSGGSVGERRLIGPSGKESTQCAVFEGSSPRKTVERGVRPSGSAKCGLTLFASRRANRGVEVTATIYACWLKITPLLRASWATDRIAFGYGQPSEHVVLGTNSRGARG